MATKAELVKAETKQEQEAIFARLLLAHGQPPHILNRIDTEKWEDACYDSIRAMLPNSDAEMVMWHYQCWLSKERRKSG